MQIAVATASLDGGRVRTWNPVTGDRLTNKGGARPVRGLAVSANGRTLAVALGTG